MLYYNEVRMEISIPVTLLTYSIYVVFQAVGGRELNIEGKYS